MVGADQNRRAAAVDDGNRRRVGQHHPRFEQADFRSHVTLVRLLSVTRLPLSSRTAAVDKASGETIQPVTPGDGVTLLQAANRMEREQTDQSNDSVHSVPR